MTRLERVLASVAALLLVLALVACVYAVMVAGPYTINGRPPTPVVVSLVGFSLAPTLVTIALGCIAGLVFLRAVRWRR